MTGFLFGWVSLNGDAAARVIAGLGAAFNFVLAGFWLGCLGSIEMVEAAERHARSCEKDMMSALEDIAKIKEAKP